MNLYSYLMSMCEAAKTTRAKSSKISTALFLLNYTLISRLENLILKLWPWRNCSLYGSTSFDLNTSEEKVCVSLTSFPARINSVAYTIKSLLLQTRRPDRITLWLAESQFPTKELPSRLEWLVSKGLEIRYCKDLKSHKKYYYALQEQSPSELVITVDDDIIYHPHTIERLIETHKTTPDAIVCSLTHIITFDDTGNIKPYAEWGTSENNAGNNPNNMPLTGSGCLYPHGVMINETFNVEKIKEYAFTVDDIWIGLMSKLSGVDIVTPRIVPKTFTVVSYSQSVHLGKENCIGNGNNIAIKNLIKEYPLFLEKIKL